jgi:hypothetical protein
MKLDRRKALSAIAGILILFAVIASIIGLYYVTLPQLPGGTDVKIIHVPAASFYSSSKSLNFTLNNPADATTVSSVKVNQLSCYGNFVLVKAAAITSESCIVSGNNTDYTRGESLYYAMNFTNGQSLSGVVYAQ